MFIEGRRKKQTTPQTVLTDLCSYLRRAANNGWSARGAAAANVVDDNGRVIATALLHGKTCTIRCF